MKPIKLILAAVLIALSITFMNALPLVAKIHGWRYSSRQPNGTGSPVLHVSNHTYPERQSTIIDPNMTFSLTPQEVTVKVGETFTIQTAINNATNMSAWQVYLVFDPTILQCTNITLPPDHVFAQSYTTCDLLIAYNSTEFTKPIQCVRNDAGTALAGDLLFNYRGWIFDDDRLLKRPTPTQTPFYGSGNLCQLEFKAIASGSTQITLITDNSRTFQSYTLQPDLTQIMTPSDCSCNVSIQP